MHLASFGLCVDGDSAAWLDSSVWVTNCRTRRRARYNQMLHQPPQKRETHSTPQHISLPSPPYQHTKYSAHSHTAADNLSVVIISISRLQLWMCSFQRGCWYLHAQHRNVAQRRNNIFFEMYFLAHRAVSGRSSTWLACGSGSAKRSEDTATEWQWRCLTKNSKY